MTRASRARSNTLRILALLVLITPILLPGCLWYLYPADRVPELLLYDSFEGTEFQERWDFGTTQGFEFAARQVNGRLVVYGPGHTLTSHDQFPTDLTVRLEWSTTNGDAVAQLYPAPLAGGSDLSLTFDEIGVSVHLSLYQPEPGYVAADTLRILDVFGRDAADPVTVESTGATRGALEVKVSLTEDAIVVGAMVPALGLAASAEVPTSEIMDSAITVALSGLSDDPRSLEAVYVYQEPKGLGSLP